MSETRSLYEQVILDHNKNPRNYGKPDRADRVVEGVNPLCGDMLKLYIDFDGNLIASVHFEGQGCAISKSSASLMTTLVKGKTRDEARILFEAFHNMLKSEVGAPMDEMLLGKLKVFSGVREFPLRVKCATLAWHALQSALEPKAESGKQAEHVSTE